MPRTPARNDLAIHGGTPVHTSPWRDGPFHYGSELKALEKVLAGPKLPLARGKWVMAYREQLTKLYGAKYAIPTSSGTTAIHVALFAAGVGAGDEVIVSPLTDYGSIIGIFQLNAIPVFADVAPDSLLMDVGAIARKITPHTKAIMPVHNGGYAVDMPALMKLARKHKIPVVEDCAQSHLASIQGKYLGTFGDLGVWSTNESKHMKSGEGGFVLTNSRKLAEKAELFSDKCYPRFPGAPSTPAFPALNVRLSDVNAALASQQLKRLPGWVKKRQAFGEAMEKGIEGIAGIRAMPRPRGAKLSYWWVSFTVDESTLGLDAAEFCQMLSAEGIPARAQLQQYVPGWEVFRRLHEDPNAFDAYRPQRLKKGSYPLDGTPAAQGRGGSIGGVQMSQHNTVSEARAAARAIGKIVRFLVG
ncbi:MAG: DegT/DnrJ/EryC1/StrS family aminotransferase [Gemmatimonadetes bacterium]|jgi:perosamine synthetase|nr:DegT/DnrJ/EryC1/StrS family aminotransferase [Gemmatimonadota bacterium]MBT7862344.1 DegT/DnrJ/EryC1/StrS family aminotransferase [Gemmatimonadota bacterium]